MDKDKLKILKGREIPNTNKEVIRTLKESKLLLIEYIQIMAELTRKKFERLVELGFTNEEALELSKKLFDLYEEKDV